MMSFKIPCGGFKLDEKSFSLDENGVLSVSGGGSGGGGVFRVNLTPTNELNQYSADKTFAEIVAAYKGGMEVEAVVVESEHGSEFIRIYRLTVIDGFENLIVFTAIGNSAIGDSWYIYGAIMGADGVVTITKKKVS